MKYLLDTDVVSQYKKNPPNPRVDAWIQRTDDREMYISDVTYAELWHGIHRLPPGKRRTDLENWIEDDLYMQFFNRVVGLNLGVAQRYGSLMARAERRGFLQAQWIPLLPPLPCRMEWSSPRSIVRTSSGSMWRLWSSSSWTEWRSAIEAKRSELRFLTPMEVIFPQPDAAGEDAFQSAILEVARARNTNAQLTEETKANQAGYYDFLRDCIDPQLASNVEWKNNDGGTIKVRDLIALAWIPLSVLGDTGLDTASFNPTLIYSSKGTCVTQFNSLIEKEGVSVSDNGPIVKLVHPGVKSALKLMSDMPKLYDQIYKAFPEAYNSTSARFGGIESVRKWDPKKNTSKDPKYMRKPACTPFYGQPCEYDYPDAFILPIVWALRSLMTYRDGEVHWAVNPSKFIENNLNDALKLYYSLIKMAKWEPNILGKAGGAYELLADNFANKLR